MGSETNCDGCDLPDEVLENLYQATILDEQQEDVTMVRPQTLRSLIAEVRRHRIDLERVTKERDEAQRDGNQRLGFYTTRLGELAAQLAIYELTECDRGSLRGMLQWLTEQTRDAPPDALGHKWIRIVTRLLHDH